MPRRLVLVTTAAVRLAGGQVLSALLGLGIVTITASALFGEHGIAQLLRLRAQREELSRATFALLEDNRRQHEEVLKLRSDDVYLEAMARRNLGLVKPNETVYRFRRPPS